MKSITIAVIIGVAMSAGAVQADKFVAGPLDVDFKEGELASLPLELAVVHTPDIVQPSFAGPSGNDWVHQTTISTIAGPIRVIEYGYILDREGHGSYDDGVIDVRSAEDFAERFACPGAILEPGVTYTYQWNRSFKDNLPEQIGTWYFIGVDAQGNQVKGEGTVTLTGGFNGC